MSRKLKCWFGKVKHVDKLKIELQLVNKIMYINAGNYIMIVILQT